MMSKPNAVRFVCCLLAFGAALVWPIQRIYQFESSPDYTVYRFKVGFYDPYDPMRGHYLHLNVRLNRWEDEKGTLKGKALPRRLWAKFTRDAEGFAKIEGLYIEKPEGGSAIQVPFYSFDKRIFRINQYPFSRYYINEQLAPEAETLLRNATDANRSGELRVRIYSDGRSAIEDLLIDGKPLRELLPGAAQPSSGKSAELPPGMK